MRANKTERGSTPELERWKRAVDKSGTGRVTNLEEPSFQHRGISRLSGRRASNKTGHTVIVTRIPGSSIFVYSVVIRCSDVMLVIGNIRPRVVMGLFTTVRLHHSIAILMERRVERANIQT